MSPRVSVGMTLVLLLQVVVRAARPVWSELSNNEVRSMPVKWEIRKTATTKPMDPPPIPALDAHHGT
ncbi:hypothetical protein [Schaalia turicensis]|uniref:hypothetical protein n=1 Tax=Schaalia turicensis TaxID=131111 RepID=UPI00189B5836|nr:hypothetical protein [Schaalia turicensis]